jgi:hypothetical protein
MNVPIQSVMSLSRRPAAGSRLGVAGAGHGLSLPVRPGQRLNSFSELLDDLLAARSGASVVNPPTAGTQPVAAAAAPVGMAAPLAPARPTSALAATSRPMRLDEFPRPAGDNGRGIHWVPTGSQPKEVIDRFVREAREMKITWVTFLNDDSAVGTNDYLVQQLVANGIMPVMRVYTPQGRLIQGDLGAMVQHYRALGVHYFQLYNEPNNNGENVDGRPNVERYLDQWTAAQVVVANGGLPGFGALSPGGNMNDLQFLDQALTRLRERGQLHLLDRAWFVLHNYSFNRPVEDATDQHGYLSFRRYDAIIRRHLGRSLPMIGTEGGTHPGNDFDKRYPVVDEARQVQLVHDGYGYLENREPYYFAYSYWIIANELGVAASRPGASTRSSSPAIPRPLSMSSSTWTKAASGRRWERSIV